MAIHIIHFAALRDVANLRSESVELDQLSSRDVAGVFGELVARHPGLKVFRNSVRAAVNQEFVDFDRQVEDGDEIAFIPPVSGGSEIVDPRYQLVKTPLKTEEVRSLLESTEFGAVILFEGAVRDHTGKRQVSWLEYDAYPSMALAKIRQCAEETETKFPGVRVVVHHRWGRLELGEVAVITGVASAHRGLAYQASEFVIDRLKEEVPIWKKEVGPDGSEWLGTGP